MKRRRSAGDGSLYFREDKQLWVAQYNGVYRYSKDKDKAKQKLRELLRASESVKPENITAATLLDQWLEYASPNLKPGTIKRYREAIKIYIKPALGNERVATITAYQVQQQYSKWLAGDVSPNVIYLAHTVLSGAFKRAAKWQLVRSNIIRDVDAPKVHRKEVEVWTPEEAGHILTQARISPLEAAYILAMSTGARGGEILALQPADYDKGKLSIRRTLVNNGTQIGTPKSKNSYRTIHLPAIARDALERHLDAVSGSVWMFPSKAGTTLFYHNFIRFHWKPLLQRAGVPYKTFHTCRHYVVSQLIHQGLPISSIARYVGDTEITLLRTYSHLINGMESLVPTAMDSLLPL
jgi:integrase